MLHQLLTRRAESPSRRGRLAIAPVLALALGSCRSLKPNGIVYEMVRRAARSAPLTYTTLYLSPTPYAKSRVAIAKGTSRNRTRPRNRTRALSFPETKRDRGRGRGR